MGKMSKPRVRYEGSGQELAPNTADCLSTNNSTLLLSLHSHSEAAPLSTPAPLPSSGWQPGSLWPVASPGGWHGAWAMQSVEEGKRTDGIQRNH